MKKILETLSDYQIKALDKKIEFRIDLGYNAKQSATIGVQLNYVSTGEIQQSYIFNTTFSETLNPTKTQERLENIKYFIDNIVVEKK